MQNCPSCNRPGRKVKRVTLENLLRADRRADIGDGPYSVCLTPDCDTVYFGAGDASTFVKSDLSVRFGLKETAPPRTVCYCFDHSIEGIHHCLCRPWLGGSHVAAARTGQDGIDRLGRGDMHV